MTGGGLVDACGGSRTDCLTAPNCAPDCSSTDFDALDATHGGQVGASIGIATPFDPGPDGTGSACIKGEWQHVRHIRPRLKGNFHARTFDSLQCACLSCRHCSGDSTVGCQNDTDCTDQGTTGPCTGSDSDLGVAGTLCNPDDRVCGPEPRRAPDNKICFSGVGDYALSSGKRDRRSVVFRVDIEDRSEPGGTQKVLPPDRYRIRLWLTEGLGDPDVVGTQAYNLRINVACANATIAGPGKELLPNAPLPDIDDGPDLYRVNHQIHPPIKDTCD